nr:hypothetical protein Q903MT_gene2316 [Picea sitchensis]
MSTQPLFQQPLHNPLISVYVCSIMLVIASNFHLKDLPPEHRVSLFIFYTGLAYISLSTTLIETCAFS